MLFLHQLKTVFSKASYSQFSTVKTKVCQENGVRAIKLCDPKTRNALSLDLMNELISVITLDSESIDLRCIVLRADGPVFSSGHNLKEFNMQEHGDSKSKDIFNVASKLMMAVVESPVPVIGVVDGLAAAAGCQLVAQCDIAICTPSSTFSTPGANFGLFCSTPGIPVARSVSKKKALQMLLTGLPINAEEAFQAGLVSKVVSVESIDNELKTITDAICSKSRSVITLGKKFFYQQIEKDLHTAYRLGENVMIENLLLKDGQEGIQSFIKKRKPLWTHKLGKIEKT